METEKTLDKIVAQFLRDKLETIRREYAPTHLVVFGPRAEGRAHADSDIDIIVVSERFRDIRFPNRMGHFLNTVWPDVHVDALCYTPDEFEMMMHRQSPFVRDAVKHGIHIE